MPTTTNFGWTTPADTDLVKDGALAIRTLGNGIDTSMVDLKGGTTGQILSKASNTDMDFTWIANNQGDITEVTAGTGISGGGTSGAVTITNSMATEITAAGDIIIGTGSGTFDNLPIGTTGQVLTADTTVSPYKVKWASAGGGGKVLQVVQNTYSTAKTIASTTYTDTDLTATITPSSTSSKVLVLVTQKYYLYRTSAAANAYIQLLRGTTSILDMGSNSARITAATSGSELDVGSIWHLSYLDSPSTTSATTYKTQAKVNDTASSHQVQVQGSSAPSVMILMEIGA